MEENDLFKILFGEYADYAGTAVTKDKIINNLEFRNIILSSLQDGKVSGFDKEMFDNMKALNIRGNGDLDEAFRLGCTLGACNGCISI